MLLMTRIARTVLVPVVVALALPGVAGAQLTKAGVVTTLQGTATVARATGPQPLPLKFKDTIFVQDRITTGDDSVARILLGGKAIVTVRERSVLTITEVPGTSTIELGIGKIALAIVKERMRSGETIEIRTPNAVAGIRGTVVITEVEQKTAQLGAGAGAFTSRFTVLQGVVAVSQYNPLTRQLGPTVNLGALQTTGITGSAPPRPPQTLTPEAARQLASEYKTTIKEAPPATNAALTNAQVQQAVNHVSSVLGPRQDAASSAPAAGSGGGLEQGTTGGDRGQGESKSTAAGVGGEGSISKGSAPSGGGETSGGGGASSGMGVSSVAVSGGGVSGGGISGGGVSGGGISGGGTSSGGVSGGGISGGGTSSGGVSGGGISGGGTSSGGVSGGGGGKVSSGGISSGGGVSGGGASGGKISSGGGGGISGGGISGGKISSGGISGGGISGGGISGGGGSGSKVSGDDLKRKTESKKKNK